jgi:hypothetical protein
MIFFFRRNLYDWFIRERGFSGNLSPDTTLIVITLVAAAVMVALAAWIARIPPNLRRYDPDEYDQRFNGIGGTLLVTAVIVSILPLVVGTEIIVDHFLWTTEARAVFTNVGSAGLLWLGFNAAAAGIRIVFALLLIWLFFRRRRVFRVAAIGYMLLTLLIFFIHDILLTETFKSNNMIVFENFTQVTRSLQIMVLATPYLLFARRVQATLRN